MSLLHMDGRHQAVLVSDPRTSRRCHQQRIVGAFAAAAEVLFACMSKQSILNCLLLGLAHACILVALES
mgnify:CR=1 FL=1